MRLIGRLSRFVWYINFALVAMISVVVFFSFDAGRPVKTARIPMTWQEGEQSGAANDNTVDRVDPQLILERDIFGVGRPAASEESGKEQTIRSVQPTPEPTRELSLRLLGTVAGEGVSSYAVLEDRAARRQDIYRIGDVVNDARIERIEQNMVVVVNSGVRHVLSLDLAGGASGAPVVVDQKPSPPQINVNNNEIVRVVSNSERQINTRASAAEASQATRLFSRVRVSPHVTNGTPDGLCISGLGDSIMAQLAGLRDGDVIQVINGHPVPDQKKAAQVLRKARKLGTARVQFARGQESRSLAFHAGAW